MLQVACQKTSQVLLTVLDRETIFTTCEVWLVLIINYALKWSAYYHLEQEMIIAASV